MSRGLESLLWPQSRAGEALEVLGRASGLSPRGESLPRVPRAVVLEGDRALGAWLEDAAEVLGFEVEPYSVLYGEARAVLARGGPTLLAVAGAGEASILAVLSARGERVTVIAPDLARRVVPLEDLRDLLCVRVEAPIAGEVDRLLGEAGVGRNRRARTAILTGRLAKMRVGEGYQLRLAPWAPVRRLAQRAGLFRRAGALMLTHAAEYVCVIAGWWLVGNGALAGRLESSWLWAWALALLTAVVLRVVGAWVGGMLAVDAGAMMKQRMLAGALRLSPEEIRHQGAGELLGRVIESEAVESLSLSGGITAVVASIEVVVALAVLAAGAGGLVHVAALLALSAIALAFGVRYYRDLSRWTNARLGMTHDLVERMAGHSTRLAQERPEQWHDGEDQELDHYVELSRSLDRTAAALTSALPRAWVLLGVLGLAPAFVSGQASPGVVAAGLGGVLLAAGALRRLISGMPAVAGALVSWSKVAPLFHAAARTESSAGGTARLALVPPPAHTPPDDGRPLVDARDLVFRYRAQGEPILSRCTVLVRAGDKLLLEGPSGGGKSTLGSVLTGLRAPESGLLLLEGLDHHSLGPSRWRRRVAAAPQFHENHVLTATFAFNLLMGRAWPPRQIDLADAEAICQELELGPLLARMPAGLLQMVGETGWQLSHGERSRLYIARALLQGADMLVLDESFAALDPETLQRALRCVIARAPTVLVIAHP